MSQTKFHSGILPVALPGLDGGIKFVRPVRVIEELPEGTHCAGVQVGALRFFAQDDPVGSSAPVSFKPYLTAYAAAAKAGLPVVNLTGRTLSREENFNACLFAAATAPSAKLAELPPVVYLTMGLDNGPKRREMIAFAQAEPDPVFPQTLRLRDGLTGVRAQVSLTPSAFAEALAAARSAGQPFVNAALESVRPKQNLIHIAPMRPQTSQAASMSA